MREQDALKHRSTETPVAISLAGLSTEAEAMFHMIATRAYELFEAQGKKHGHDLDHWLQAEDELFGRPALSIAESEESVTVLAQVRGFTPGELEVELEPRRVTIIGRHSGGEEPKRDGRIMARKHGRVLLRSVRLPVDIDTQQATAHLIRRGILELDLKKAVAPSEKKLAAKPADKAA